MSVLLYPFQIEYKLFSVPFVENRTLTCVLPAVIRVGCSS